MDRHNMIVTPFGPCKPFSPEEIEEILDELTKQPCGPLTNDVDKILSSINEFPEEVTKNFRRMINELNQGLPKASSGEVLSSRTNFRISKI